MKNTIIPNSLKQASKKIVPLALSMAGIQLITVASGFLCMIMLSRLGPEVLAACALIISSQISIMVVGMSLLFSLSILIGHAYGAKNYATIGNFMQQGWTLALLLSLPIILIFLHIGSLLVLFGQAKPIAQLVQTFFHGYVWAVVPILLSICNQQLCYGIHKQKLVILSSTLSVIVLLVTAYVLIFGKFGFPALGVMGLGYAMAAQGWFMLGYMFLCLYKLESFKLFDLFNYRVHKDWSHLLRMFKIGWPISVQISGEVLSLLVMGVMVGWIGLSALAAFQVVNQYLFLIVIPIFTLSQAIGILIGQACGAKQYQEIKLLGYASCRLALIFSSIAALLFWTVPKLLASAYLDIHNPVNAATVHSIVWLFAIVAVTQIFDGLRNVLTGALRGLFDTKFPMFAGRSALWILGIPLSYYLAFVINWGLIGIAIGSLVGMLVGSSIVFYRWHHRMKKIELESLNTPHPNPLPQGARG